MKFRNLKIGVRLTLAFFAVLVLLAAIAATGLGRMKEIHGRLTEIVEVNSRGTLHAVDMRTAVYDMAVANRNVALLTDPEQLRIEAQRVTKQEAVFDQAHAAMGKLLASVGSGASDKQKELHAKIGESWNKLRQPANRVTELGLGGKGPEAIAVLLKEVRPLQKKLQDDLNQLVQEETRLSEMQAAAASASYSGAVTLVVVLSVLALVAGILMGWLTTRGIVKPLHQAVAVAEAVAAGDLTTRVEVESRDETGRLMQALQTMNDSLAAVVAKVRQGTDTIATASGQIATGNQDLSARTEEQASSLEETAASIEELTGTVRQNADNARQADQLAHSAAEVATQGGAVVNEVVDTMASISAASRKMADIIAVIDGIAFQTNILALNAAVEAARAGEQGRGFAVVAGEVRNLAQRSATAAREIKSLIEDADARVHAGSDLVTKAGATMQEVVASVKRVTDIMGDIAAASQEQSRGIEQVNQAITQMDQVTQQNAALVEEAAAAAQSLREQAGNLVEAVAVFRVGADQEASVVISQASATSRHALLGSRPSGKAANGAPRRQSTGSDPAASAAGAAPAEEAWAEF